MFLVGWWILLGGLEINVCVFRCGLRLYSVWLIIALVVGYLVGRLIGCWLID